MLIVRPVAARVLAAVLTGFIPFGAGAGTAPAGAVAFFNGMIGGEFVSGTTGGSFLPDGSFTLSGEQSIGSGSPPGGFLTWAFFGRFDPAVGMQLTLENFSAQPMDLRLDLSASMAPQFAGAPLSLIGDVALTDGSSESVADGSVALDLADGAGALASAFVRSVSGNTSSFGFFPLTVFENALADAGPHHDESQGSIAFDAGDAFAQGIGFPNPWNEMLLTLEGTLSPGDTLEFDVELVVAPLPPAALLMLLPVALLLRKRG